jgi:radical SAM superfamily enzyme
MGIESFRDKTISDYKRGRLTDINMKALKEMKDNSCYVIGSYIFCHEQDTKESMRADIEKLASLDIPAVMPTILTPYSPTPLFDQFQDRIIDWNWDHWDDGHLVWRHPEVTPQEASVTSLM